MSIVLQGKNEELAEFFKQTPRTALGFSGGVDSSYLLYAGLQCGADVRPYYIKTAFQPQFELDDALRMAEHLGAAVTVLEMDILSSPLITSNPPDRCYHCKSAMLRMLRKKALTDGYSLIIDGTNASDSADDRPGMRALTELSVRSPLRECGLSKDDIRRLSKEAGLFTWNKPAYSCLATRVPAGNTIDAKLLYRIEGAEKALSTLGFANFRARVYDDDKTAAHLQFSEGQADEPIKNWAVIRESIRPYFDTVMLDPSWR